MSRKLLTSDSSAFTIMNALTVSAFPPIAAGGAGAVPAHWISPQGKVVDEFDLEIWAAGTTNLTLAELFAARAKSQVIVDDDVDTVDFGNNELDLTSHAYKHGDGPLVIASATTLPAGLSATVQYWAIYINANTIKFATSRANALAGTAVAFTDAGTGTHTISDVVGSTTRLFWLSVGLLGHAKDGAVSLLVDKGYKVIVEHLPRTVAYCVDATFSAAVAVTIEGIPLLED